MSKLLLSTNGGLSPPTPQPSSITSNDCLNTGYSGAELFDVLFEEDLENDHQENIKDSSQIISEIEYFEFDSGSKKRSFRGSFLSTVSYVIFQILLTRQKSRQQEKMYITVSQYSRISKISDTKINQKVNYR
jgi:hypothetical protein